MKGLHLNNKNPEGLTASGFLYFPGEIIKGEGAVNCMERVAGEGKALFFAGKYTAKAFGRTIKKGIRADDFIFSGEACPSQVYKAVRLIKEKSIKTLIAAGGGKAMDTAKYIRKNSPGLRLVLVPTSAATCAAITPVSVMYDEDGSYMSTRDSAPPDAVIMDYGLFQTLPAAFFAAGAADAIAKYYEALCCAKAAKPDVSGEAVISMLKAVKKSLNGIIRKNRARQGSDDRAALCDINIMLSGLASCAGRYTPAASIAHGLAHALTGFKAARGFLHGEHIAPSLIIQEAAAGNAKNLDEITGLFEILEMPLTLKELGIKRGEMGELLKRFEKLEAAEKFYVPVKRELLYNVIDKSL
ncbi:MAG TPA: iron-containing alcohol dehydrogenase [bacterium]|nr:iron-containing alcohol dehydrogenase [bacterium]